ncbi:MAG: hypothetical protein V4466_10665 [Pseudomonadota bacterium]
MSILFAIAAGCALAALGVPIVFRLVAAAARADRQGPAGRP